MPAGIFARSRARPGPTKNSVYPYILGHFAHPPLRKLAKVKLRVILKTAKQAAAAKGGLAIFGLQSAVNEVFEISGLQKFIPITSDETEARSRLGG
jgi:hypothetical protein